MKTEIIYGMSNSDYHAHPSVSKSGLDLIALSPAHFRYGTGFTGSTATRVGSAFHALILERREPLIAPNVQRRSKDDRQAWADWMTEHGADGDLIVSSARAEAWLTEFADATGTEVLTPGERTEVEAMRDGLARNAEARALLLEGEGDAEVSMFDAIDDVAVRTRPDLCLKGSPVIVDLKTALSARPHEWARAAASRRYSVQQAMYSQVYAHAHGEWPDFPFVVIEKSPPYCCVVYRLIPEAVENGHYLMTRDLATYRECMASGEWPGYPDNNELTIPIYERETFALDFDGELTLVA